MKRKIILCMLAMTVLLLGGCAQKNTQGGGTGSAAPSEAPAAAGNTGTTAAENAGMTAASDTATPAVDTTGQTDQNNQTAGTANSADGTNRISEEEARKIALTHAGFTADQVTFIKSELENEENREHYDVEFYTSDQKEYDYEIDSYTGDVLAYDQEAERHTQADSTAKGEKLSEEQAKKIVLEKVPGATDQDFKEFREDYDNDRLQYEGKIHYEKKEYEFEIDGYNGEILEWDVETLRDGVS